MIFISKRKLSRLLDECDKKHGLHNGSYNIPEDKKAFYFDMGSQSVTSFLRNKLQIKGRKRSGAE